MLRSATARAAPLSLVARSPARLLETKLYVPRARGALVARPELVARVREGVERRLTLVVAPAGFGKTTLLAAWLAAAPDVARPAAWVSLDPSENEPALFWAYVVRALQKVHPGVGDDALALLQSPHPPAIESVLATVINEIDALDAECLLVLDDYHVIDAPAVHAAMAFLLDRLPARMHVVIASRAEPPLPLARLRARGELTELRPADLRFSPDEALAFLNDIMALGLSAGDAATLGHRTEGWIAGLKLAALSMRGRGDVRAFVDAFSGDHRHVADYLVDEVLGAEPPEVRRFLLGTSILDRLSGPLCDAVTGGRGSQALLETLERRNLFVVALDDRREWYRYHHLFAEVLQAHAAREDPDAARDCHRRASEWYDHAGAAADAVRHAIAAGDLERTAALLERAWPEKDRSYESARWLARVRALPEALVRARPVLGMGYAWALLNRGELEAAEARLDDVERRLGDVPDEATVVADQARFRTLSSELASARVYLAQARGDAPATVADARRVLDAVPAGDLPGRATATALLALAHWSRGELDDAHRTFADALALMRAGGNVLSAIRGTFVLGDLRAAQGRLREAMETYERGLAFAAEQNAGEVAEIDELHIGLSELHREWGDLAAAVRHLDAVATERASHAGNRQRWCAAAARVREARGDLAGALALLDEAETREVRNPLPRVRPIDATRARLWIAQGRLTEAGEWARDRRLSVADAPSYAREFEHVTLARLLIARGERGDEGASHDAAWLLARLAEAAEAGGRWGSVIECLVLHAVAARAVGDVRVASHVLARAVALAEPERYLRVFVDEGRRVRDLLRHVVARGAAGEYARHVLAAFDAPATPPTPSGPTAPAASPPAAAVGAGQALTARELEIVRLIAAGLRNGEIAEHLAITPATVKRHVANAYAKLGARHRTEALARARALRLL